MLKKVMVIALLGMVTFNTACTSKSDIHLEEHVFGDRVRQIVVVQDGEIIDDYVYLDDKLFYGNECEEETKNIDITKTVYHEENESLLEY